MKRPRIDLLAPPFSGHLHPVLAMGRALTGEYQVRIVSTPGAQARIREAGLEGISILSGQDAALQKIANPPYAVGNNPFRLHKQFSEALVLFQILRDELLELYQENRPDLLVADFTLVTAGIAADKLGIPWWTSLPSPCVVETRDGPPAYMGGWSPRSDVIGAWRDKIGRLGVRAFKRTIAWLYRNAIKQAGLVSIYRDDGSEAIYSDTRLLLLGMPQLEFKRTWPQAAIMIGPMLYTPHRPQIVPPFVSGRRHVLVTMGTHLDWIKNQAAALIQLLARDLPDIEFHFTDGREQETNVETVENFSRLPFVDYERFVSRYDLIVHHGGAGIMYYCLREGKRAIVCPIDYDQFDNAARLLSAGLAYRVHAMKNLRNTVLQALADDKMDARCQSFAAHFKVDDPCAILKVQVADFLGRSF